MFRFSMRPIIVLTAANFAGLWQGIGRAETTFFYRDVAFRTHGAREGAILPKFPNLKDTLQFEFGNKVSRDCRVL